MEHILKYFTELDAAFKKANRRVQIRVYPPQHHALGGQPYKIDVDRDEKGSLTDIRIGKDAVPDYTFHSLDINENEKKIVVGVRYKGRLAGSWFFGRNNQGRPVSKSGIFTISGYEKALAEESEIVRDTDSGTGSFPEDVLKRKIKNCFAEMGMTCRSGLNFFVGRDESIVLDFSRITAILDRNVARRQVLLKGNADVNYLCGMDEMHPFIAGVTGEAKSIRSAHRLLQPGRLDQGDEFKRQGEWFFIRTNVPKSVFQTHKIERYNLKRNKWSKPHVAEMVVKKGKRMYARGWVEHEDHSAVFLDGWHRVEVNREIVDKHAFNPD